MNKVFLGFAIVIVGLAVIGFLLFGLQRPVDIDKTISGVFRSENDSSVSFPTEIRIKGTSRHSLVMLGGTTGTFYGTIEVDGYEFTKDCVLNIELAYKDGSYGSKLLYNYTTPNGVTRERTLGTLTIPDMEFSGLTIKTISAPDNSGLSSVNTYIIAPRGE
jgi:hypothetical protein